jgi:hypothetical protein
MRLRDTHALTAPATMRGQLDDVVVVRDNLWTKVKGEQSTWLQK